MRYVLLLSVALAGCTTMAKQGITQDEVNRDKYECERDVYDSRAAGLSRTAMFNDCMRARGYVQMCGSKACPAWSYK